MWDSSRTCNARTAQQIKQHRLGLVATMMRQQQHIGAATGQRCMTRRTRRSLKPVRGSVRHRHPGDFERNFEFTADVGAECRPVIGIRRQPVMHVHRRELTGPRAASEQAQENDGVAAAGEPDTQSGMGRQAGSEKGADPRRQIRKRLVP